jgi:hypothetical protein
MMTYCCLLPFIFCLLPLVQGEGARQIIPEEFVKARPAKSTAAKRSAYRRASSASALKSSGADSFKQLGLTIWRLRPSRMADAGARIIVQEGEETLAWTPERVEAGAPLRFGDRIRLTLESPQTGYLYVIDREQYADGTLGEPYLIFPTTRTRQGDNQVAAGRVIEIPGQEDRPNFFTLRQSRTGHVGEVVTVMITPQPLADLSIGPKALTLPNEQVAKWEKAWATQAERFEMVGGTGRTWTKAEQEAGADGTRLLTQDDPGPQTIYRVAAKPGEPILVKVGLRYRKTNGPTRPSGKAR